jgi:predicted glycogen debranching enzyme
MISCGRDVLRDYQQAVTKEWLVTNSIGGYAGGTVAGTLTRRYHGLLIAALDPPLKRTLLLSKVDENAAYRGRVYPLFTNHWASGTIDPTGYRFIEQFRLEGAIPIWTFSLADAQLEKQIWMQPGANTTYLRYAHKRGADPITLTLNVLVNYRDHHANTSSTEWPLALAHFRDGLKITMYHGAAPFFVYAPGAEITVDPKWNIGFFQSVEAYRGLDPFDNHLRVATLRVKINPGGNFLLAASTLEIPDLDGESVYADRRRYELGLLRLASRDQGALNQDPVRAQLVLAADQFIVNRPMEGDHHGQTIMAGFPWFTDWGRDTMISLPGLTLATGRPDLAKSIIRTFTRYIDKGMLPNRFPEAGQEPEYNTVDATLWYFEAVRAYFAATKDAAFIRELYPALEEIILWHRDGTRFNIRLDRDDGLLYAGEPGVQLTWMDAKVGDWVVTPRIGKPVEVNALWFNALQTMREFSAVLGKEPTLYDGLAKQMRHGFDRFWNKQLGYCFDVLDGPDGTEDALRPNQLLAVSLAHSLLSGVRARSLVDACAHSLYTSHGLRSLAPDEEGYTGHYGGDQKTRDAAYHQGTVWAWLIGPFISAHLKVYQDPPLARSYLKPLFRNLFDHGLGSLSEIFDGAAPHAARGCFAQAWSVAEALRVLDELHTWERKR